MRADDGMAFLRWAMPRLGLDASAFRRVRRQVLRRIDTRCRTLGVDLAGYRAHLAAHPDEWPRLDGMCRVTISRFGRDAAVWSDLVARALPALIARARSSGRAAIRAWSAGCGAGEEPYTLAMAWRAELAHAHVALSIVATDVDEHQLARAAAGSFPTAAMRELPATWRALGVEPGEPARIRDEVRRTVRFEHRDVRAAAPEGPFDLVLCRNLAFSYFDAAGQLAAARAMHAVSHPGGLLIVGRGEVIHADGWVADGPCRYLRA